MCSHKATRLRSRNEKSSAARRTQLFKNYTHTHAHTHTQKSAEKGPLAAPSAASSASASWLSWLSYSIDSSALSQVSLIDSSRSFAMQLSSAILNLPPWTVCPGNTEDICSTTQQNLTLLADSADHYQLAPPPKPQTPIGPLHCPPGPAAELPRQI